MEKILSRLDLNLLVTFYVLLEEKNTVKASERLFTSQSAISRKLNRLRTLFNDELFIRGSHGLHPTPKALALKKDVQNILQNVARITQQSAFDPAVIEAEITIGIPEPLGVYVIPLLITRLKELAPGIVINSNNLSDNYLQLLRTGALDFVLYQKEASTDLISSFVGRHELVCLMRKDHPLSKESSISNDQFHGCNHIIYSIPTVKSDEIALFTDEALNRSSSGKCLLQTTQLSVAIELMLSTDAIMLVTPGTMNLAVSGGHFVEKSINTMPVSEAVMDLYLSRHIRTTSSVLHQWLSVQISELVMTSLPKSSLG